MGLAIMIACGVVVLAVIILLSVSYIRRGGERDEFKRIAFLLTKLIRKAIISGSNGRMVTLSRTMDILGGVFSDSGIEKADDPKSVSKIREKLEHLLKIDKIK